MNKEWELLLDNIQNKKGEAASWRSDKESLIEIIRWAIKTGIVPNGYASIDNTKLRTIIKEAKKAINENDPARLIELFDWAKNNTVIVLRQKVGITTPEHIAIQNEGEGDNIVFVIKFTPKQFERMKASTIPHFSFDLPKNSQK